MGKTIFDLKISFAFPKLNVNNPYMVYTFLFFLGETEVDQDAWFGLIEPMPDTHIIGASVLMRDWDFWIFGGIGNSGEVFNDIYRCKHFWKIP